MPVWMAALHVPEMARIHPRISIRAKNTPSFASTGIEPATLSAYHLFESGGKILDGGTAEMEFDVSGFNSPGVGTGARPPIPSRNVCETESTRLPFVEASAVSITTA